MVLFVDMTLFRPWEWRHTSHFLAHSYLWGWPALNKCFNLEGCHISCTRAISPTQQGTLQALSKSLIISQKSTEVMFWNTVRDLVIVIDCNINKSMHTFMNSWKNTERFCCGGFIMPARECQMLNLLASVASILLHACTENTPASHTPWPCFNIFPHSAQC